MKQQKQEVEHTAYDETWVRDAWGEKSTLELLANDSIASRPRVSRAVDLANFSEDQLVLDIACGRGEIPAIAAQKGADAVGLDFSNAVLDIANKLRNKARKTDGASGRIELVRADACSLPFANESFDRVTMLDIIEHLTPQQLKSMFQEVSRVLKHDGYAVIHTLPNRWVYDITFPIFNKLSKRIPANPRSEHEKIIHINEQSLPDLKQMVKSCGLNSSLWLEQQMAKQARWNSGRDDYRDTRDTIYPLLTGSAGYILELMSMTPLKLILCNDIYGILWKGKQSPQIRTPWKITEILACLLKGKDHP